MRIPYAPEAWPTASAEEQAIVERLRARRAPRPLQRLDLALLHSPPVADGWNSFLGAVRTRTSLAADLRELAICRVAVVNRAWYEWDHHAPLAAQAGVSELALVELQRDAPLLLSSAPRLPPVALSDKQWAVLCYADEMTRNVEVRDDTFARIKELFGDQEIVDITATVACYNCVSRFLVALDVGEKNGIGPSAGRSE